MSVGFARPDVSQLAFRVYDRSVHPELYESVAVWTSRQPAYDVRASLARAGHVVEVRFSNGTMTELALPEDQSLPAGRLRLERTIAGSRTATVELADVGVRVQTHHQVEEVDPEVFLNLHEEFVMDCRRAEVAYQFAAGNRFAPVPISLLRIDAQADHVLVHAYHTFPATCSIVRTQSLLEL